ncbi:Uma2 family endonuclease [Rubeoparvulum massiliense]|uniref:Uma2 family endonuclease n=1 Tax=Rubeoparvulum massiliense TaxID=1631346 RepID=UPI0021C339F6|nr:Uma2 family endonuclease [Rubeoparvulum massiliense]
MFYAMRSYFQNHGCLVFTAPFNVYFSVSNHFEKPDDIMQPDITVVCNKNQIVSKGCFGAPTLIVEVLSPATALKDYNEKFYAYQRYGVKEYWIVDTANRMIHVYHLKDGAYLERVTYGEEDTLRSIEYSDLHISLRSIFALEI